MTNKLEGDTTGNAGDDADKDKNKAAGSAADDKPTGGSAQAGQTGGTVKPPDEDWEKRFKGLQPIHQTLVEDHKGLKVQLALDKKAWDTEKAELDVKIDGLEAEKKTLAEGNTGLTESGVELKKTVDSLEAKLERNTLIMSEYPDLAVLEAKGLIRQDLEGDELTKALTDMRSLMVAKGEKAAKDLVAGSSADGDHKTGSRSQSHSVSSISELLMKAQVNKDADEITRLTDLLVNQAEIEVFQQE